MSCGLVLLPFPPLAQWPPSTTPSERAGTVSVNCVPLHLTTVPALTFEMVTVPATVIKPGETLLLTTMPVFAFAVPAADVEPVRTLLPEAQPAATKPRAANNATAEIVFILSSSYRHKRLRRKEND